MSSEPLFDEIPAPGEPLLPKVAPENARLLEDRLEDRRRRLSARLSRSERFRLNLQARYLRWRLMRANYKRLAAERDSLSAGLERMREEYARKGADAPPNAAIAIRTIEARERELNATLAAIQPIADDFAQVVDRLRAHEKVTRLEREDKENRQAFLREKSTWEHQIRAAWRKLPQCHHRWADKRGNWITEIPVIRRAFLAEDSIRFWIGTSEQGLLDRMLQKWRSALPYGVTIDSLTSEAVMKTVSATCRRQVEAEISPGNTNVFYKVSRLDSPDGIPRLIHFRSVVEMYPKENQALSPWPLGVTTNRKLVWMNFRDGPHVLIAGSSGSGKSNAVNVMLATLASMNGPDELRVVLIDNKGGIEFTHWAALPHLLGPVVKDVKDVLPMLERLRGLMERRFAAFERVKAKNFLAYNEMVTETSQLPRILILIDELATLTGLGETTRDIHQQLTALSSQGRAVGVHLVLATQHSIVDIIPGRIKTNMSVRIAGRTPDRTGSEVILGTDDAYFLPKVPGRMAARHGVDEYIVQAPFISDSDIEYALRDIRKRYKPGDDRELGAQQLEPEQKFGREQFLGLVVDQLGGHVSYMNAYKLLPTGTATRDAIRELADEVISEGSFVYRDIEYEVFRRGKGWYVREMHESMHDETEDDEDSTEGGLSVYRVAS